MRLSPVLSLLILLAEQAQGFQRACAGVLEVLTALQQENRAGTTFGRCHTATMLNLKVRTFLLWAHVSSWGSRAPSMSLGSVLTSALPQYQMALMTL